jgi:hypothetical protein
MQTQPHPIKRSDLPTFDNRVRAGFNRGFNSRRPMQLANRHMSPVAPGSTIHSIYGNGNAIEIIGERLKKEDRLFMIFSANPKTSGLAPVEIQDGRRHYFLLTEGLDESTTEQFLSFLPRSFGVSQEQSLIQLGLNPDSCYYRPILLPVVSGTEKTSLNERQAIPMPQALIKARGGLKRNSYQYAFRQDRLEAQALLMMMTQGLVTAKWHLEDDPTKVNLIWNKDVVINRPIVKSPEPRDISLKLVEAILHPTQAIESILWGVIEAVKSI